MNIAREINSTELSSLVVELEPKIRITYLVLLSLLMGDAHGYEIMKRIRSMAPGNIRASAGSIYPILKKLESMGLVERKMEQRGKIPLIIYSLSDRGLKFIIDLVDKNIEHLTRVFRAHIDILHKIKYSDIDPELKQVAKKHVPELRNKLKSLRDAIEELLKEL